VATIGDEAARRTLDARFALAAVVLALPSVIRQTPAARRVALAPLLAGSRTAAVAILRFVQRGIPEIDAGTAGIFRVVFGLLLLVFFWSRR
jgi:hypothetical protein